MVMSKRPSIGIDGYNIAMPHGTGVASYGRMLVKAVEGLGYETTGVFGIDPGSSPSLGVYLFYDRLVNPPVLRRGLLATVKRWAHARIHGFPFIDIPRENAVVVEALDDRLPRFDRIVSSARLFERAHKRFRKTGRFTTITLEDAPDIMHWTYPVPLRVQGARNIYTIHDLVPLRLPYTTRDDKTRHHALIAGCVAAADRICTVSNASKADIESLFPAAIGKTVNTYQVSALELELGNPLATPQANAATRAFGLEPDGYFLFFGASEPKKNIGRLLEAYFGLKTQTPLVLVSGRGWHEVDELSLLNADHGAAGERKGSNMIIRINHLRSSVLAKLVASARAVTFPSLYEGFGLPAHEAMLLGAPLLTSNTSALPEIAGDAAILVDPYDVEAIREGLLALDSDPALRQKLRSAGRQKAATFSMQAYGTRLDRLYDEAMGGPVDPQISSDEAAK